MELLLHVLEHAFEDTLPLVPFLLVTYLVLEALEHAAGERVNAAVRRAGAAGPVIGAVLGIVPQCGFSAMGATLYAGRVITLGTLVAVFLSTSDEMLPLLVAERMAADQLAFVLFTKAAIAAVTGLVIDVVLRALRRNAAVHEALRRVARGGAEGDLIEEMAAVFVRLAAKAVKGRPEILVVGLGNRDIRADALGIEVINRLIITRPYFEENSLLARGARTELSAIAPGVYGLTGIQSGDIVKAVAEKVRPNLVIAVDSLAAARVSRLYSSYQITTAGIQPGSGISSGKKYIDFQSLGVPVISVGVPLALYAASLLREGIVNFIKLSDRRTAEYDINSALEETLTQKFSAMVVAPKQIEDIVENCAEIIAASVNLAFQGKTQKERIF